MKSWEKLEKAAIIARSTEFQAVFNFPGAKIYPFRAQPFIEFIWSKSVVLKCR
jgi:hypothetical protein